VLSKNVTVPLAEEGKTFAVSFTFSPAAGDVFDASSVVVVVVGEVDAVTVIVTGLEVLAAYVLDPP
jgi:hypothetical protein